jgi:prepilin-type N-terminal cleavage/methylation domain-containing protein
MKSKLNRRRGFTIAEIIIAVAIMATLVAVLMKGLQTSKANIKRDTYKLEANRRIKNLGVKAEAHVFQNGTIGDFKPDPEDLEDPVGETYVFNAASPAKSGDPYTITLTPKSKGALEELGIATQTYTFK